MIKQDRESHESQSDVENKVMIARKTNVAAANLRRKTMFG